ncbi:aromatic amino acid transaminase [Brevundimonas sp. SL130]|uniref:aromatic amino acid transaminase n=1 Tax=Brevundimonas sp. SL130 TaxID=2995143 RepID=UPI00226CEB39|nr:aromatic amino acid transaminase [Brevundimonas sp. SL130]WAC58817.1 aromatic amino acid transaminase [Brevundimonas sp. SL130]
MFDIATLPPRPADPLLALIGSFRSDPRVKKIDLGVGVYRNCEGRTPVMAAVKAAERLLVDRQSSKAYLGPEGDLGFVTAIADLIFTSADGLAHRRGVQTPGGAGALRLAAELLAESGVGRIHAAAPTWPNHAAVFQAAGLTLETTSVFDLKAQTLNGEAWIAALETAPEGDAVLLHGCCHNPTGLDLSPALWAATTEVIARRNLLPVIDLAYLGLGKDLDADGAGMRLLLRQIPYALIAVSCDKNFGLYRERTGALFVQAPTATRSASLMTNLCALARANWSMPPDHGAAIVRTILEDPALKKNWKTELQAMQTRIAGVRSALAATSPQLSGLREGRGMFANLAVSSEQVQRLKTEHAVYMAGSGRINLAGLSDSSLPIFADALRAVS